jgi:hypothetical protein
LCLRSFENDRDALIFHTLEIMLSLIASMMFEVVVLILLLAMLMFSCLLLGLKHLHGLAAIHRHQTKMGCHFS